MGENTNNSQGDVLKLTPLQELSVMVGGTDGHGGLVGQVKELREDVSNVTELTAKHDNIVKTSKAILGILGGLSGIIALLQWALPAILKQGTQ